MRKTKTKPVFLEFFAGSGLVAHALHPYFRAGWANDISVKKAQVYQDNHPRKAFQLGSVADVKGDVLPEAALAWASFPCQDLSLAGAMAGIHAERSGLVWEWLRVMDEMSKKPPLLVAENVTGLVSANNGEHYRLLHNALIQRGYRVGALLLDAVRWVPQSRPRIFVVAVRSDISIPSALMASEAGWAHSSAVRSAAKGLENWVWWNLPEPALRKENLADIIEWDAPCDPPEITKRNLDLVPEAHFNKLQAEDFLVAPGYKRIRNKRQVLELRFDGVAGCLRTPKGGSSRQFLVLKKDGELKTRLLTVRETARLMGAPDTFKLPGSYNDGYMAMGDAVAAPVARYLAKYLLSPLAAALL
ncbi:DNA cytosine methyltransferase [Salmonella enterica subsp. enterica serovar Carmel]|nr:DNA cytosine methyltransferase [Salmonella enterica subsp. enterica serovar Carmel]